MATINKANIIAKILRSPKVLNAAVTRAQQVLNDAKESLIEEFLDHPVTKELREGEAAENISNTLGGYGNLFSFIGFNQGDDPTEIIQELLDKIRLSSRPILPSISSSYYNVRDRLGRFSTDISIRFEVKNIPTIEDIEDATPYPDDWREGSWVKGIERGIPGLEYYLYDEEFGKYEQSRSSTGLQAKDGAKQLVIIRDGAYRPTKYISQMLKTFNSSIRGIL